MIKADILEKIAESVDPDDIIDRLQLTSEQLTQMLSDVIMDNLEVFDDVIELEEDDD